MEKIINKIKEDKQLTIISILIIGVLFLLVTRLTYAYLAPVVSSPQTTDIGGSADLVDDFKFVFGDLLNVNATPTTLPENGENFVTSTTATAKLRANSTNNIANYTYYLYLSITDNTFDYIESGKPEMLLTITNPEGGTVTSLGNLTYTTYDGVSGFDITTSTGLFTIADDYSITSSSSTTYTEQEWIIKITYFNQDFDQSANFGNSVKTALSFKKLGIPQVNEVTLTSTPTSVTATVNANPAADSITKYYYSLNDAAYIETTENPYTFQNLDSSTNYKVSVKVLNSDGNESSVLSNTIDTKEYVNPSITNVTATSTVNQITITVTAQAGTSAVSKYYYSINDGAFVESTSNSYTFTGLTGGTDYTIKVKTVDTKGKESSVSSKTFATQYVNPSITNVTSTTAWNQIKVTVTAQGGTNNVSKYYYSINGGTYQESTSNTYTFSNLNASTSYTIKTKVVDTAGKYSSERTDTISTAAYVNATITSLTTSVTSNSIKVTPVITQGTGTISKYYYSNNGGSSYTESTSNNYTFTGLSPGTSYSIKVYIKDSNGKTSNTFTKAVTTSYQTLAAYIKGLYTSQGSNGIYLHNSSLANSAKDNSYRYAGANPNNYVCFGSTASTCPTDNLYRIIGVFGNQVKLIKSDYATSTALGTNGAYNGTESASSYSSYKGSLSTLYQYFWASSSNTSNVWSGSPLNTINLNGNYISHLGTTWTNKIATTSWKVGGNTSANIATSALYTAYQKEITSPAANTTYSAKIGLMYVSDYGYAASPTYWTYPVYSSSGSDYSKAINANWMYMGYYEWMITRVSTDSLYAFYIYTQGCINYTYVDYAPIGIRPVFYLNSSVTRTNGTGTSSNPYRLS